MARKYTSKETSTLINQHKENIKKLETYSLLPTRYASNIRHCVDEMFSNGAFKRIVADHLQDKALSDKILVQKLIQALYLYKRAVQQSNKCKDILLNNKERIQDLINDASIGLSTFLWMFASTKKKQNAEAAYEELKKETYGCYYWASSQEVFSSIAENDGIGLESGLIDFNECKEEYKSFLKQNAPTYIFISKPLDELQNLVRFFDGLTQKIEQEVAKTELKKDNIKKAAERMAMTAVMNILETVPVEELNRDKKGFRVKALRDDGYETMADVYIASAYELASVYGISEDAAYSIKDVAKKFAIEAKKNAKIKLSIDDKTKEATNLVSEIFKYRQYLKTLDEVKRLKVDYGHHIDSAATKIKDLDNYIFWIFLDDDEKEKIKNAFKYLIEAKNGDYGKRVNEIVELFKKVDSLATTHAWEDFKNNSIAYYNILEELVPGVLGNDDKLYGLPEDLAREIQEECFFPDGLNCELRRYQEWGVKYILHQERVLLGDEMGLGKTIQAIATMVSLKNVGATHFIVVCPASVLPNWCKEIVSKSKLHATKIHGAGRIQAIKSWIKTGGVAVTTYETTGVLNFEENFK